MPGVMNWYHESNEWLPFKALGVSAEWVIADRTFEDSARLNNRQQGNLLRLRLSLIFK
jgi:hypothetical protein